MKTTKQVKNEIIEKLQNVNPDDIDTNNVQQMFAAVSLCESCNAVDFPEDYEAAGDMAEKCGYDIIKMNIDSNVFDILN